MNRMKANFCNICAKSLTEKSEVKRGYHEACKGNYCNLCGNDIGGSIYGVSNLIVCGSDCYTKHQEAHELQLLKPLMHKYPNLHYTDIQWIYYANHNEDGGDEYAEFSNADFKKDINGDDILLLLEDSDNRISYETVPAKLDVLKYAINSKHRQSIAMNCNLYIVSIIYKKRSYSFGVIGNGRDIRTSPSDGEIYSMVSQRTMSTAQQKLIENSLDSVTKLLDGYTDPTFNVSDLE